MSGAPTPPVIVEAFATSGTKTNPIPVASQIPITPGRASLTDGFPPLNSTPLPSGGVPPFGSDMNGILYMITAHLVALQAGQPYHYDATLSAALTGYAAGAIVASASVAGLYFYNTTAGNTNDPDVTPTNWIPFTPLAGSGVQTLTLGAGTTHDQAITAGIGFLDITANAAGSTLDGIVAPTYAQTLIISNVSAPALTLGARTGSTAAYQFRLAAALTLLQWQSQAFKYSPSLTFWIPL